MTLWSSPALACALCIAGSAPPAADSRTPQRYEFARPCMGTLFRIVLYSRQAAEDVEAAVEAAFAEAGVLDACLSDYLADSEVGKFHRSEAGAAHAMSPPLRDILKAADEFRRATGSAFDPARGSLTRLWRMARRTGKLPAPDQLAAALDASGMEALEIDFDGRVLRRKSKLVRLDFGGIAKGAAADAVLATLATRGIRSASVAAGGDVRVGSPPPGGKGWKIAIRPAGDRAPAAAVLLLSDAAVSTSGSVEQRIAIDGKHYSHIIDPATGLGMRSARAATVIAPTAIEADALATALCVVGRDGLAVIRTRTHREAALFEGGKPVLTEGFAAFSIGQND